MGQKNPDRVPLAYRRARCETVADMFAQGWDVVSKCGTCGLVMQVDLDLIAWRSGAKTSLWNRKARCRRLHCVGVVEFMARAPGMDGHQYLRADDRAPAPETWGERMIREAKERERGGGSPR
jgi:hypothetical protein